MVDWGYLGRKRFAESFFEQTIEHCMQLPFNLLFRHQTPVEVLGKLAAARPGLAPTGFIFHESRCGSTLVARMLATLEKNVVISEARLIDAIVRASFQTRATSDEQGVAWLRWLVSAYAQPRFGNELHLFIKFDAWSIVDLPFLRRAFPDVPWIFLYRDPVEVMVSQMNQRALHTVPGTMDPALIGLDHETVGRVEPEEYVARVLAAICQAALRQHADGLLINYKQLPEAVCSSISKFFGVGWTEAEMEKMLGVTRRDAKDPSGVFRADSARKRDQATERVREAANRWLYPIYEELEAVRLSEKF
jgi:hypothetical protein